MVFHHIGIVTEDIQKSVEIYIELGYMQEPSFIFNDELQNAKITFMYKKGSPLIELVMPLNSKSHLVKLLSKNGPGPYHTCYEVTNIDFEINFLKSKKFILISSPKQAIAFNYKRVAFLFNRSFGILELLEN
jgi:methylmalonyl-CoA/ethylmalonyl-CoA epimerase